MVAHGMPSSQRGAMLCLAPAALHCIALRCVALRCAALLAVALEELEAQAVVAMTTLELRGLDVNTSELTYIYKILFQPICPGSYGI